MLYLNQFHIEKVMKAILPDLKWNKKWSLCTFTLFSPWIPALYILFTQHLPCVCTSPILSHFKKQLGNNYTPLKSGNRWNFQLCDMKDACAILCCECLQKCKLKVLERADVSFVTLSRDPDVLTWRTMNPEEPILQQYIICYKRLGTGKILDKNITSEICITVTQ